MTKFLFTFLLSFASVIVYGQCCSAGNPVGGDGAAEGLGKNELRLQTSYRYSLSSQYYHHDSKVDVPYIERSYYNYQNLMITYGVLRWLSLHAEFGYFYNKAQYLNISGYKDKINASGPGDLTVNLRFIPLRTVKPASQLVISAGTKIPVGAFHEEIDGITIPVSLQPSSGAMKYSASIFYFRKKAGRKLGWNSFALFEISQTINKGYLVYRYGNYYQFAFAGTYEIIKDFSFAANAKFEWRGRDQREMGAKVESSGGFVVFFNPQLSYNLPSKWAITASAEIPVYKYVNGYQLTNRFAMQIGIKKSFLFCKGNTAGNV